MERQFFIHRLAALNTDNSNPIFVSNDGVLTTHASFAKDAVSFIGIDNLNIPIANSKISKPFYICQNTDDVNEIRKSKLIYPGDVLDVQLALYKAAVKQKTTISGLPNDGGAITSVNLKLVRVDKNYTPDEFKTYTVPTKSSVTLTCSALRAAILANSSSFVVTSGTGDTLVLETKEEGVSFYTVVTDQDGNNITGVNIGATATPTSGTGTPAHIKALQEEAAGLGYLSRTYFPQTPKVYEFNSVTLDLTPSVGYDLVFITVKNNNSENVLSQNKGHVLILAYPASATAAKSLLYATTTNSTLTWFKTMFGL